jgi:hypothetical protein
MGRMKELATDWMEDKGYVAWITEKRSEITRSGDNRIRGDADTGSGTDDDSAVNTD